jgi:hypothetical protein
MYFHQSGHCKFGSSCHQVSTSENCEVKQLKITLQQVLNSLTTKEIEMKKLDEKVNLLEISIIELKTHKTKEVLVKHFKCDQCPYACSSSTVLKSHTTKKHKVVTVTASLPIEQLDGHAGAEEQNNKCVFCEYESTSSRALSGHISLKHTHKCHICYQSFDNTHNFKAHMTNTHGFSEDIDVCYECEDSTEVGRYRAMIAPNREVIMQCAACLMDESS